MYVKVPKKPVVRFWAATFRLTSVVRHQHLCVRTRASQLHGLDMGGSTVPWLNGWQAAPWGR